MKFLISYLTVVMRKKMNDPAIIAKSTSKEAWSQLAKKACPTCETLIHLLP